MVAQLVVAVAAPKAAAEPIIRRSLLLAQGLHPEDFVVALETDQILLAVVVEVRAGMDSPTTRQVPTLVLVGQVGRRQSREPL
jgi:hypothetical protein